MFSMTSIACPTAQNVLFNDGMVVGGFERGALGALVARYSFGVPLTLLASI
jgi:hypothetical protein